MKISNFILVFFAPALFPATSYGRSVETISRNLTYVYKDKNYSAVRSDLIKRGYHIVKFQRTDPVGPCPGDYYCNKFPEVIDCSGSGVGFCDFAFHGIGGKGYIIVSTSGEYATVDVIHNASEEIRNAWRQSGLKVE
jgi:hypothetical protein